MADIKNIGANQLPQNLNLEQKTQAAKLPPQPPQSIGDGSIGRDALGQPFGLPPAETVTQNEIMPAVTTGRDATQLLAAENLRANAGQSAVESMLGLNQQPSTLGVLLAPPGNLEALRHLTPAMRRNALRSLLSKQRGQMHRIVAAMRQDEESEGRSPDDENQDSSSETELQEIPVTNLNPAIALDSRPVRDLQAATRMLDLLDEMLGMQDYTLSQMGTFAQG